MIVVRPAAERGRAEFGWLDSRHTFSFGDYYDPKHMGFGPLRVINEDRVRAGAGFDTHSHRNMEIISYVLEGALEHKDSIGTGSVIRPGDVQIMSAGTGISHSEFNHSKNDPVHFLQIWILPKHKGIPPRYDQKSFPTSEKRGRLRLVGSNDGRDGSVAINQDVSMYDASLGAGDFVSQSLASGRKGWVQITRGSVEVNGKVASAGDGVAVEDETNITVSSQGDGSEFLAFDLP
ncbi:MAG: quercetin 2,3-dioxygenase [Alphaproteobacteria bacterium]|nr:quercetin 2,3-dioxygenase [Alphaproteobacteria bacterium]